MPSTPTGSNASASASFYPRPLTDNTALSLHGHENALKEQERHPNQSHSAGNYGRPDPGHLWIGRPCSRLYEEHDGFFTANFDFLDVLEENVEFASKLHKVELYFDRALGRNPRNDFPDPSMAKCDFRSAIGDLLNFTLLRAIVPESPPMSPYRNNATATDAARAIIAHQQPGPAVPGEAPPLMPPHPQLPAAQALTETSANGFNSGATIGAMNQFFSYPGHPSSMETAALERPGPNWDTRFQGLSNWLGDTDRLHMGMSQPSDASLGDDTGRAKPSEPPRYPTPHETGRNKKSRSSQGSSVQRTPVTQQTQPQPHVAIARAQGRSGEGSSATKEKTKTLAPRRFNNKGDEAGYLCIRKIKACEDCFVKKKKCDPSHTGRRDFSHKEYTKNPSYNNDE